MAHGDYICCGICDMKLEYEGMGADKKTTICEGCVIKLNREYKLDIYTTQEFIDWINKTPKEIVYRILHQLNFTKCHYENLVDDAVETIGYFKEIGCSCGGYRCITNKEKKYANKIRETAKRLEDLCGMKCFDDKLLVKHELGNCLCNLAKELKEVIRDDAL